MPSQLWRRLHLVLAGGVVAALLALAVVAMPALGAPSAASLARMTTTAQRSLADSPYSICPNLQVTCN